jgi:hypothetical protein
MSRHRLGDLRNENVFLVLRLENHGFVLLVRDLLMPPRGSYLTPRKGGQKCHVDESI